MQHISLIVTDVEASVAGYQRVLRDPDNIQLELNAM
ncbi:VOC family protein [Mycobacterium sp. 852013-51886_SCH5428379]